MKWIDIKKAITAAKIPSAAEVKSVQVHSGIIRAGYIFVEYNDPKTGYCNITIPLDK